MGVSVKIWLMTQIDRRAVRLVARDVRTGDIWLGVSGRSGSTKFPGGGVEEGETLEQAAARELNEESGGGLIVIGMTYLGEMMETLGENKAFSHWLRKGSVVQASYFLVDTMSKPAAGDDVSGWISVGVEGVEALLTYDTQKEGFRRLVKSRL